MVCCNIELVSPHALRVIAITTMMTTIALAQCTNAWATGDAFPGVRGQVYAMTPFDPDGAGPTPMRVAMGGYVTLAGSVQANNIAAWDPAAGTWSTMGVGLDGYPRCMTATATGGLVVGGEFLQAGGLVANGIALWDGVNWSTMGSGMSGAFVSSTPAATSPLRVGLRPTALPIGTALSGHPWGRAWTTG